MDWSIEDVDYLRILETNCKLLAEKYKQVYDNYKKLEGRFKIPSIIISSTMGLLSFGSSNFGNEKAIQIIVGCVSVGLSILTSIESYLRIGQIMSSSLVTSNALTKLSETINLELSIPIKDRSSTGALFLRGAYTQYDKIIDQAPNATLKKIRFINNVKDSTSLSCATSQSNEKSSNVLIINN